ncbi:hypothetical protein AWW66_03385 [Micromonospora rosaria]|uniref:Uncharacterized protein n=1 Tax=Micromonospora rosaria TaxID=47874 RepID=A0A136PY21_9ACTN|nr:hypothetical protein [Micromonospora rosaria]KXK63369.1 hypothetical protein AWW66_03385 [Micromonospora rosaria]
MGARLVSLVLARWAHLPDRAFRVAVKMALSALDEAKDQVPAATYFAGRDPLVTVLRNERAGGRDTATRTVGRAIEDLLREGAIERVSTGRSGKKAIYRLTLLNTPRSIGKRQCTVDSQGDIGCPPEEDTGCPPQEDTGCPDRGTPGVPPRNQEEPLEEPREETRSGVLPVVAEVPHPGGHAGPRTPRRPDDPSGRRTDSDRSLTDYPGQPPRPETATYDRAREGFAQLIPFPGPRSA